jgi:exodeoxyribonuclease V alpha subunit
MIMLDYLLETGLINELDAHFARFIGKLSGKENASILLGAALASRWTGQGHICLFLPELAGKEFPGGIPGGNNIRCPDLILWETDLRESSAVGKPGETKPLILDTRHRLYLQRYFQYERNLAENIPARVMDSDFNIDMERLKADLIRLFPENGEELDLQMLAAATSVLKGFCVISGGPGTGKTYIAARILQLLESQTGGRSLNVALAAPTGKAAAKLADTIQEGCGTILAQGMTVHRLLHELSRTESTERDAVVVDEASMADLSLMSRLMTALPSGVRIVWLGDKDQLSSVEAGAVLGDVCGDCEQMGYSPSFSSTVYQLTGRRLNEEKGAVNPLRDSIVLLKKNYRFAGGIGSVSRAVNRGDGDEALERLMEGGDVQWRGYSDAGEMRRHFEGKIVEAFAFYLEAEDPGEAFSRFNCFRVLCALRRGPFGVESLNRMIEKRLGRAGLINPYRRWYAGRPVLITKNDYSMKLFNGDVGITMLSPEGEGEVIIYFPDGHGGFRRLAPPMLPEHETVFAMTVHKSQGSEFDEVLFLLPPSAGKILTRELIYTGITRARERLEIWGKEKVFREAVGRRINRNSGLREALWGVNHS